MLFQFEKIFISLVSELKILSDIFFLDFVQTKRFASFSNSPVVTYWNFAFNLIQQYKMRHTGNNWIENDSF